MNEVLLVAHIITGSIGLLSGSAVMIMKKADRHHKLVGTVFFYTMSISMLFSLPISFQKSNIFLFSIGIWTLYMLITGVRALKKINHPQVNVYDWLISLMMLIFGLTLFGNGIYRLYYNNNIGLVAAIFGLISLIFVFADFQIFSNKHKFKNQFLVMHIQRMVGAYISSFTAFLVVNNTILPGPVAWLLPTAMYVPFIIIWIRKWGVLKSV